jgi:hypothetical protein
MLWLSVRHHLGFHRMQPKGRCPGSTHIAATLGTIAGRSIEVLIHNTRRRLQHANGERLLLHTLYRSLEGLHVSDLSGHQELQCIDRSRIVSVVYETLVHDLYNFKMAEFFCSDVEQQVTEAEIVDAVPLLDGVLHRRG